MDRLSPERRSWLMSRVGNKNTTAEVRVRRAVHFRGFRYRLHRRHLPGTPDLTFPRHRIAVFVHGCFWHRHVGCSKSIDPKTRVDYWQNKFAGNVERDRRAVAELEGLGWRVHVIWECETKDEQMLSQRLTELFDQTAGGAGAITELFKLG
jgi:DNA mismatch endonuclease, patch repair protein